MYNEIYDLLVEEETTTKLEWETLFDKMTIFINIEEYMHSMCVPGKVIFILFYP